MNNLISTTVITNGGGRDISGGTDRWPIGITIGMAYPSAELYPTIDRKRGVGGGCHYSLLCIV